jgi:hypothetical protein
MSQLTMTEWDRRMAEGETTYAVGPVPGRCVVFSTRTEAEQAAAEGDGLFIQWDGRHGHQVETELEAGS